MASVRIISAGLSRAHPHRPPSIFGVRGDLGVGQLCSGTSFQRDRPPLFLKVWVGVVCLREEVWKLYKREKETTPHLPILPQRKAGKEVKALGLPRRPDIGVPMSHPRAIGVKLQI